MVIVPVFHMGGRGSIHERLETLGSVVVNHSLTGPRCKNSECWEDLMHPQLSDFINSCFRSPQDDSSHQGWVGSLLGNVVMIINLDVLDDPSGI